MKKLATVLAASLISMASAQAALIEINVAYGKTNAENLEQAFFDRADTAALAGAAQRVTEDFSSFAAAPVLGGNQQNSYVAAAPSFNTLVGTFTMLTPDPNLNNEFEPENLMIESNETGEFGRDMNKADGDLWLDSNDAQAVTWDIDNVNAGFNSLGFYIVDANDQGATLILRYNNGSQAIALDAPLSNGNLAYVNLVASEAILGASLVFDNNGDRSRNTNDGWAIDNVTLAQVSAPATIAMMGLALFGLGIMRRISK